MRLIVLETRLIVIINGEDENLIELKLCLMTQFDIDSRITFIIDTSSTNINIAFQIADLIQQNKLKSDCVLSGQVQIFGLIIAMACRRSMINKSATVHIKIPKHVITGNHTPLQMQKIAQNIESTERRIAKIISARNPDVPSILDLELEYSASEIVGMRLVDAVSDVLEIHSRRASSIYN